MNAKRKYNLVGILVVFLLAFRPDPELDYQKEFGNDYEDAVRLAEKIRPILSGYAAEFGEDPLLLESIIFPELIRYNRLYDVFETGSLCLLYSRFGSDYANFSIGYFQMKPGFAQSLEAFLYQRKEQDWVIKLKLGRLREIDDFNHRMDRVRRLQDPECQMLYLVAFIKSCRLKHAGAIPKNRNEEIMFLATAYNAGWQLPENEIRRMMNLKYFHVQHFNPAKSYAYAEIALHRYRQLLKIQADIP